MMRYLRAANVKDGSLDLNDVQLMNFSPAEQAIFSLIPGDVLVTEGSGSLGSVGASTLWQGELSGTVCFQNTLIRLRPRDGIDARWLNWWARSAFASGTFASIASGANIYHLSAERVRALPIQIPSRDQQRRVADFLDAETARIEHLIKLQKILLARIDERDKALRDIRVDDLFSECGELPLRRFTTSIEQGTSPQCEAIPRELDEWGVLKLSSIRKGEFEPSENKRLPKGVEPVRVNEVRLGDLLVTRANTPNLVGDVAVVKGSYKGLLLPDLIYRVGLLPGILPEFVAQVAMSSRIRTLIQSVARGSSQSMVKLRGEDIKAWPIPKASHIQQEMFVGKVYGGLAVTGRLRSVSTRQLNLLAERRQALITAAVTGEFDVSTASGRGIDVT